MPQASVKIEEISRIADQLKRAFEGDAWHGPAVLEVLEGVSARPAAAKPIPGAHSIWEIVLHIAAWDGAIRRRMEGQALQLSDEQDFPPVKDTSDAAWRSRTVSSSGSCVPGRPIPAIASSMARTRPPTERSTCTAGCASAHAR